jgi:hypothetical protein
MATATGDAHRAESTLFARKATGLVRGWAVRDAFIYSTFSINLITLGLFIFTYAVFIPRGSLLWGHVHSSPVIQGVTSIAIHREANLFAEHFRPRNHSRGPLPLLPLSDRRYPERGAD